MEYNLIKGELCFLAVNFNTRVASLAVKKIDRDCSASESAPGVFVLNK